MMYWLSIRQCEDRCMVGIGYDLHIPYTNNICFDSAEQRDLAYTIFSNDVLTSLYTATDLAALVRKVYRLD